MAWRPTRSRSREDGVYVGIPAEKRRPRTRTVTDVMAETLDRLGRPGQVFGMVGHSNLGLADALRLREKAGALRYSAFGTRAPRPSRLRPTAS